MSIFSFAESYSDPRLNPYDISRYIDRVSRRAFACGEAELTVGAYDGTDAVSAGVGAAAVC